jgi:hypothetical protein
LRTDLIPVWTSIVSNTLIVSRSAINCLNVLISIPCVSNRLSQLIQSFSGRYCALVALESHNRYACRLAPLLLGASATCLANDQRAKSVVTDPQVGKIPFHPKIHPSPDCACCIGAVLQIIHDQCRLHVPVEEQLRLGALHLDREVDPAEFSLT